MIPRLLCLALVLSAALAAAAQNNLKIGSSAPAFSASSVDGKKYDLNELRGSVVVLTFWSTRCIICQSEMPKLDQIADRYKDRNVTFLSATPENESSVKYYLSLNRVRSTILPDSFGIMLNYADRDGEGNVNIAYPAFFVIGTDGTIQYRGNGYSKTAQVAGTIDRLLASVSTGSGSDRGLSR